MTLAFTGFTGRGHRFAISLTRAPIFAARTQAPGAAIVAHERIGRRLVNRTGLVLLRFGSGFCLGLFGHWLTLFTPIGFARGTLARFAGLARLASLSGLTWFARLFPLAAGIDRLVEREIAVDGELAAVVALLARLLPAIVAAQALLFLADAGIGDNAKIVIGELEVLLRQDPIAVLVRVLRELAILLEQLRRVAPRAAIDPVQLLATATAATTAALRTIVAAAAPTVIPTIVVQG